jgi:hypothetical protein
MKSRTEQGWSFESVPRRARADGLVAASATLSKTVNGAPPALTGAVVDDQNTRPVLHVKGRNSQGSEEPGVVDQRH